MKGSIISTALREQGNLVALPVLAMAGTGDRFIAPPEACRKLHELLPGTANVWQECGVDQGFAEDFTHSRLISSRAAARQIWPRIADWLAQAEARTRSGQSDCNDGVRSLSHDHGVHRNFDTVHTSGADLVSQACKYTESILIAALTGMQPQEIVTSDRQIVIAANWKSRPCRMKYSLVQFARGAVVELS